MTRPVHWKPWTLSCWHMTSLKQLPKSNIQQDENTQEQEAIFTAGVQNAEGVCHVLKISVSRIHTGGGNWSNASVDGFHREYPILCNRL